MKKIVVILIVGLYIGSIFLVNFFGLQYAAQFKTEYVSQIECNTIENLAGEEIGCYQTLENEDGQIEKWFKIKFIEGEYTADDSSLANNPNTFKIICSVLPDNAKNKTVELSYVSSDAYFVNKESMTVVFLTRGSIAITIRSTDGLDVKERIVIEALKKV